jgi:hypothetical protein
MEIYAGLAWMLLVALAFLLVAAVSVILFLIRLLNRTWFDEDWRAARRLRQQGGSVWNPREEFRLQRKGNLTGARLPMTPIPSSGQWMTPFAIDQDR